MPRHRCSTAAYLPTCAAHVADRIGRTGVSQKESPQPAISFCGTIILSHKRFCIHPRNNNQVKLVFCIHPRNNNPSRVSLFISILRLILVLISGIPPEFRDGVHLFIYNRHTPSGQSRVYRVTQLRTDGVHCREFAGAGPINLKVVPNECCLGRSPWTN